MSMPHRLELAAQVRMQANCCQDGRDNVQQCWLSSLEYVHYCNGGPQAADISPESTAEKGKALAPQACPFHSS